MAEEKNCKRCAFYWRNGTGYSDWTWMDTEHRCFKGVHPKWPMSEDDPGAADTLNFAAACTTFDDAAYDGDPILISPDGALNEGTNRAAYLIRKVSS